MLSQLITNYGNRCLRHPVRVVDVQPLCATDHWSDHLSSALRAVGL